MITYFERMGDGTIGVSTPFEDIATSLGLFLTANEEIVTYENKRYLQSEFEVIKTTQEYIEKQFAESKDAKLIEIDTKAYEYENNGLISYEGLTPEGETKIVQIETTDKNIGKINGLINMFNAGVITDYLWSTKDDTPIVLQPEDCYALTGLFAEFSAQIWMVKQPGYKAAVEACVTAQEVDGIVIDYSQALTPNEENNATIVDSSENSL